MNLTYFAGRVTQFVTFWCASMASVIRSKLITY